MILWKIYKNGQKICKTKENLKVQKWKLKKVFKKGEKQIKPRKIEKNGKWKDFKKTKNWK